MKCKTGKTWNLIEVSYYVNDILVIVTLLRIFYFIKIIIILTKFFGDRADRVSKMMGYDLTMFFSMKCLIIKYPIQLLGVLTVLIAFTLAFMIKILEGPVYYIMKQEDKPYYNDYRDFSNCMWNMFVTMTTVGYGDYFPLTNLGRIIIILCALSGIILVSLITVSLQNSLVLDEYEHKVYDFVARLEDKDEIKKDAAGYFHKTFKYFLDKQKFVRDSKKGINFTELNKRKTRLLNTYYSKIKMRKSFKKQLHKFQNIYGQINDVDIINKKIGDIEVNVMKFTEMNLDLEKKLSKILKAVGNKDKPSHSANRSKDNTESKTSLS